ncbi:aspartate-semialdehyde dehydrogenase [Candidatus Arthromitus sp. SFB-turkey]|uniref:aspartate-semialdehyde dehydrogenase n=1 Tax=Candidatus Arthromitus sp. SFB-turkey TaxID=1840217 RepID=UPI0007F36CBB|nr:aspartate-semialdehyde dehydrogenase [Candidatus Arthromitus sp. SFB-turkey]OAT88054.1 aspartate-semialdehyde dehydrogenase [Candidatus Arthromitus sp. SFB-turkey]
MKYNVAIVGATGKVGRTFLEVLEKRNFPINNLYLYASKKSAGLKLNFKNKEFEVIELIEENIREDIDFAFFSAGGDTSLKFSPIFAKKNAIVIDNSSAFRMDPNIPLIVPEVNGEDALNNNRIIANPNCSTIQAVVALKPLHDKFKIKRIIYSTYQAVSGAGNYGVKDLNVDDENNLNKFQYLIKGNLIPQIDVFLDNGYTKEEMKMINETKKILKDNSLKITATCVRVPVENSHSESINIEFENSVTLDGILNELKNSKGLILMDDIQTNTYPMPKYISGKDEVYVGRVRIDESCTNSINIWVVADNILKGAALNAIQIAEYIIENKRR